MDKSSIVTSIPNDVISNVLDYIIKLDPRSDAYTEQIDLEELPNLSFFTKLIAEHFPDSLPVDCILILGSSDDTLDSGWHIDIEAKYWGNCYKNLIVPVFVEGTAGLGVLEGNLERTNDRVVYSVSEDLATLEVADVRGNIHRETFVREKDFIPVEVGKGYLVNGSSPHVSLNEGLRVTIIVGFISGKTLKNPGVGFLLDLRATKTLNLIYKGQESVETAEVAGLVKELYRIRVEGHTVMRPKNKGWRTAWRFAMGMLRQSRNR